MKLHRAANPSRPNRQNTKEKHGRLGGGEMFARGSSDQSDDNNPWHKSGHMAKCKTDKKEAGQQQQQQ